MHEQTTIQEFQKSRAASLARIMAGTEVLVARITVDGDVLVVQASDVQRALVTLHGEPAPGLEVTAKVEYLSMPLAEFKELPDFC